MCYQIYKWFQKIFSMKCLYWNIGGIANSPSKLALKNILKNYKPDLRVIAEPWMSHLNFFQAYWDRFDLKLFVVNNRDFLVPNLWCICKDTLDLQVQSIFDQHVSFQLHIKNITMGFVVVYASTCYVTRRRLWSKLSSNKNGSQTPWCFIEDYNSILGSHEHMGYNNPSMTLMKEFKAWSDMNNLVEFPTKGPSLTWYNGMYGLASINRKLEREFWK